MERSPLLRLTERLGVAAVVETAVGVFELHSAPLDARLVRLFGSGHARVDIARRIQHLAVRRSVLPDRLFLSPCPAERLPPPVQEPGRWLGHPAGRVQTAWRGGRHSSGAFPRARRVRFPGDNERVNSVGPPGSLELQHFLVNVPGPRRARRTNDNDMSTRVAGHLGHCPSTASVSFSCLGGCSHPPPGTPGRGVTTQFNSQGG
jgi:hypothetical protein